MSDSIQMDSLNQVITQLNESHPLSQTTDELQIGRTLTEIVDVFVKFLDWHVLIMLLKTILVLNDHDVVVV